MSDGELGPHLTSVTSLEKAPIPQDTESTLRTRTRSVLAAAKAALVFFACCDGLVAFDQIYLLSTRDVGSNCDPVSLSTQTSCHRLSKTNSGTSKWVTADFRESLNGSLESIPTIIYVHGNRVPIGEDRTQGLRVYHSLVDQRIGTQPIRFIIWSWPSEQIAGIRKDYQVKAERTVPAAWQLAWFISQMPEESQLGLVGYSYGARVVTGSMHLLGGGQIGKLRLDSTDRVRRPHSRIALMAAAYDADWILPGNVFGKALTQVDRMVVITNRKDPAMRFYPLSTPRKRVAALGKVGVTPRHHLGHVSQRIREIDVTSEVGRSHVLEDYLSNSNNMKIIWQELLGQTNADAPRSTPVPAYAHLPSRVPIPIE